MIISYILKFTSSQEKNCAVSCIGCGICARNCPNKTLIIENSLARIDYTKCTNCGLCKEKCPRKCIITA